MRSTKTMTVVFGVMLILAPQLYAQFPNPGAQPLSAMTVPQAQLMQPAELVQLQKASGVNRPSVLQVGSHVMFAAGAHSGIGVCRAGIAGSGAAIAGEDVASTPKNKLIVIYCGCCPWNHCPNIGPAYKQLQDLGFTNVKALYIANNFGDDWVAKGYAVEKGE